MKWKFLLGSLINILIWTFPVFGNHGANENKIIANLLQDNKPVIFVSCQVQPYFNAKEGFIKTNGQNLIKNGNHLYVFINGTGRLYKIETRDTGLAFIRTDTTDFFGYNIGALAYSYKNRIYNIGGYGFWRMNGQLRVFNEIAGQWDIVKLNEEIPLLAGKNEGLIWYDITGGKIYTGFYLERNEAVKRSELEETQFIYDVMVLDLQKNEWQKLGSLNNYIKEKMPIIRAVTMSPWGQIITIGDKVTLLDFKKNLILSLDTRKEYYQSLIRSFPGCAFYFKDSTLYYGSNDNNKLDSVVMHYSDFIPTGLNLYSTRSYLSIFLWIAGILLFIGGIIYTIVKVRIKPHYQKGSNELSLDKITIPSPVNPATLIAHNDSHPLLFEEMEINLIQMVLNNSSLGRKTSVDELNKILGIGKKSMEIQKKRRSDIITTINRKFSFVNKEDVLLIQRVRTDEDKRAFEYFIDFPKINEVYSVLDNYTSGIRSTV